MRSIKINGKDFELKYTLESAENIQEKLGINLFQGGEFQKVFNSPANIAFFILEGIRHADETVTLQDVKRGVETKKLPEFLTQCFKAYNADAPAQDLDPTKASQASLPPVVQ